jgi:hypothetical protein
MQNHDPDRPHISSTGSATGNEHVGLHITFWRRQLTAMLSASQRLDPWMKAPPHTAGFGRLGANPAIFHIVHPVT